MQKRKTGAVCLGLILFCAVKIPAGDIASFVDLGFSQDGRYYAFAQFGVEESSLFPWAEIFIVDVAANDFVNGGRIFFKHAVEIEAGQDGSGAFYRLVSQNTVLAGKYGINFLRQGIPLFISLENGHNPAGDFIEFRDFESDILYSARLIPTFRGTGINLNSSFMIDIERSRGANSIPIMYKAGTPDVRRPRVTSYTIKKTLTSPDRKSMVFVIEMTRQTSSTEAPDIRYMVETVRF